MGPDHSRICRERQVLLVTQEMECRAWLHEIRDILSDAHIQVDLSNWVDVDWLALSIKLSKRWARGEGVVQTQHREVNGP